MKGQAVCSECGGKKFTHVFKLIHVKHEIKTSNQAFIQIPDDCYIPNNLVDLIKSNCVKTSRPIKKYEVFEFRFMLKKISNY